MSSSSGCKVMPILVAVTIIAGAVALVVLFGGGDSFSSSDEKKIVAENAKPRPTTCPAIPAGERFVMFWQSENEGCDDIPDGVTHAVFGFAEVENGIVVPTFQGNDNSLKKCLTNLRKRCIFVMGSVGGANNVPQMAEIKDPEAFAQSVLALAKEYNFDGIDIDDETVGIEYDETRVMNYMTATSELLKADEKNYILTWDGLVSSATEQCVADPTYSRCYPTGLNSMVDWVNILAYNINEDSDQAAAYYEEATNTTFKSWIDVLGDRKKAALITCIPGGCAYGDGPSLAVNSEWTKFAATAGGMGIYTGSADKDFKASKLIIEDQSEL